MYSANRLGGRGRDDLDSDVRQVDVEGGFQVLAGNAAVRHQPRVVEALGQYGGGHGGVTLAAAALMQPAVVDGGLHSGS